MDCDGGDGETLTPLGAHLAALPVDARLGKFILLGAVFGAVDATLTIAATISTRSPFLSPFEKRQLADAAKRSFAIGQSDHLAVLNAYGAYDALPQTERCPLPTQHRAPQSRAWPAIHRVASSRATLVRYDFAREHFLGSSRCRRSERSSDNSSSSFQTLDSCQARSAHTPARS